MEHIKVINARQAESASAYNNMKQKMPKMKANIWFNKICGSNRLTPESVFKYIIKSVVHIFGYFYVMDLINAREMEQMKAVFFLCTLDRRQSQYFTLQCKGKYSALPAAELRSLTQNGKIL